MKSRSAEQHDDNDEKCEWAFLMIDVINDLDFPGNEHLIEVSSELADNILSAKKAARDAGLPTIYE
jgi:nicotinamidase-related amidase